MKILLIDNSTLTKNNNDYSIEPGMGNFAKELQNLGNEVTFFGQIMPTTKISVNIFSLKKNNIQVAGSKRLKWKFFNYIILYFKVVPEILRTDFIYIFYPSSFKHTIFVVKLLRKKYGLYIRGNLGIKGRYSDYIYKSAFTVNTVSDIFTDYVNKVTNRDLAHTIKPMLQYNYSDIVTDRTYCKKSRFELLYFGRLTDAKGLNELIYAMSILIQKQQNVFLTIVGTGQYHEEVLNLTKQLNLSEFISFEGAVYDSTKKQEYYKNADIFILPSYNEGFPRSIYESMVFGTPIITTFVGGIPSLMKDNINALEIDVKSVDSIVDVVIDAVNNYEEKMKPIAQNATRLISTLLAKEKLSHAERLHSLLSKL